MQNSIDAGAHLAFNCAMLRLLLLRHAKAVAHNAQDHSRALAPRGREDAHSLGLYLHAQHLLPNLILTSDALRTQETAMILAKALQDTPEITRDKKLYLAEAAALLNSIQSIPPSAKTCLLVGHNPGFHELAQGLVGYGDRYAAARLRTAMPTCALAVLDFDCEYWSEVRLHQGRLERFIIPEDLNPQQAD